MGWGYLTKPLKWRWTEWAGSARAALWQLQLNVTVLRQRHRQKFIWRWLVKRDFNALPDLQSSNRNCHWVVLGFFHN